MRELILGLVALIGGIIGLGSVWLTLGGLPLGVRLILLGVLGAVGLILIVWPARKSQKWQPVGPITRDDIRGFGRSRSLSSLRWS